MSEANQRSRSRMLLYPKFQLAIIAASGLVTLVTAAVCLFMVRTGFQSLHKMGEEVHLEPLHPYFDFLDVQSTKIFLALGMGATISLVLGVVITLFISHRLVGPLHRLRSYLKTVVESGDCDMPLQFRSGDYLSDLPEIVSQALSAAKNGAKAKKDRAA